MAISHYEKEPNQWEGGKGAIDVGDKRVIWDGGSGHSARVKD